MALETLCKHPSLPVERVVCLGSPLRGSGAAKGLHRYPLVARCAGRSDSILCRGLASLPTGPEVGMLAGRSPMGLGAFFGGLHGEHDGTVGVEETRIPGLADHQVVDASHTGMLLDADVASQVDHFLRTGRFA